MISISFVNDDKEIDYIPLSEIEHVKDILEKEKVAHFAISEHERTAANNFFALQISTIRDGHNSGRIYYLRTKSREALELLKSNLKLLIRAAKGRSEAQNSFRRAQQSVRGVYESSAVQVIVALLITAVSIPSCEGRGLLADNHFRASPALCWSPNISMGTVWTTRARRRKRAPTAPVSAFSSTA